MSVSTSIMNFLNLDAIRPLQVENKLLKSDVAIGLPAQKQNCADNDQLGLKSSKKSFELNVEWR